MDNSKKDFVTRLLTVSRIDNKDDLEERLENCYHKLQSLSTGLSEKEYHDKLTNAVCKDKTHEEVCIGLLSTILVQPEDAVKTYRDLTLVTRDGLAVVIAHLNQLVLEKYLKLHEVSRNQLLWLLREMIRTNVTSVDSLCISLLRHTAGGDISQRNIFLVNALLDIFQENRLWVEKFPFLIASIVYTYLRLIEDHNVSHLVNLKQKEVIFLVSLIRDRIMDCTQIGRDLVRLLQNVARIPEFEALWKDMLLNPQSLHPSFTGVLQLLQTRTSRRFLQSRLTPDMERKLVFLTSQVKFGNHKRYQEWFQRQYLATPESQTLRCDLIRFIVGVIHPTNELLCSDIIPRWAIIGWLFTTCTLPVAASNAKLALFYDWLFFQPGKDNIMNIEPAILVMHNSMKSHPAVTATLLDFLCRIIPNFHPSLEDKLKAGIFSSLRQILEKRVLPSLHPLFDSPKLDRELRTKVRETFKEFCISTNPEEVKPDEASKDINADIFEHSIPPTVDNSHLNRDNEPAFSDDEDDIVMKVVAKNEKNKENEDRHLNQLNIKNILKNKNHVKEDDALFPVSDLDSDELKKVVRSLNNEKDNENKCTIMEQIVQMIIEDEIETETIPILATCILYTISAQVNGDIFPANNMNDEALTDSISTPLFVMFRNYLQLCKEEDTRKRLLARVLAELQLIQAKIGYLLLYFLKVWTKEEKKRESELSDVLNGVKALVYKEFCLHREEKLDSCLLSDLKRCHEDNVSLLGFLLPDVYMDFQNVALGNIQLMYLVVSTVDSLQLQDLICQIMQGNLKMLKKESFAPLINASSNWDTFEQYCFWQLIFAHDFPLEYVISFSSKLNYREHAEALTTILLMLKKQPPTQEILKQLLSRQSKNDDPFVVTALKYWYREYKDKIGDLLSNLLSTRFPASPKKSKRATTKQNQLANSPTGEQILGHLDQLRQQCMYTSELQLYQLDNMQKALQQAQTASSDALKKSYSDLFALAEVNEDTRVSPPISTSNARKKAANAKEKASLKRSQRARNSESSDQSSEEEIVKPKQVKKRKKLYVGSDDSD